MYKQNRRTLRSTEGRARLDRLLDQESSRTELSRRICEAFGFRDAQGRLQQASCLVVLRELDTAGLIQLPPARSGGGLLRRLGHAVPLPTDVPERGDRVAGLRPIPVETADQRLLWTEMVAHEHPRGAPRHVGHQLRYLRRMAGWGLPGSPRRRSVSRRGTPGWDRETRERHLHRVLCLSRARAPCKNLASKMLGLCLRRVGRDFESRYGFRPFLAETFVDPSRHDGASLRAANWQLAGKSAGRSRWARPGASPVGLIYLYALGWRRSLGVTVPTNAPPVRGPLGPADGLDRESWAENEDAPLGDKRLTKRLMTSAAVQAERRLSLPRRRGGALWCPAITA